MRIADTFAKRLGILTTLYTLKDDNARRTQVGKVEVVPLFRDYSGILPEDQIRIETNRYAYITLNSSINSAMSQRTRSHHVLVSLFVSNSGELAQEVADEIGISHICCVRGSDFSLRRISRPAAVFHNVVSRASHVVTVNQAQEDLVANIRKSRVSVTTIHNAITDWANRRPDKKVSGTPVIFCDTGLSARKGAHVLLAAISDAYKAGFEFEFILAGGIEPSEKEFWIEKWRSLTVNEPRVRLLGEIALDEIRRNLFKADLYCSATLGEGCSNARMRAFLSGLPMVTTRCGALLDIAADSPQVLLSEPTDVTRFTENLKLSLERLNGGGISIYTEGVTRMRKRFSADREAAQWRRLFENTFPRVSSPASRRQPRLLFFCHDGAGLGHMRRLSRIALQLQGSCSCLFLTGHRHAGWVIPEECEFVHIPSLDSFFENRSEYWGLSPFLRVSESEAFRMRGDLIRQTLQTFQPDAVFMDYLPFGKESEMKSPLLTHPARKYFVIRGVMDSIENCRIDLLGGDNAHLLASEFDRIFVTSDKRVVDVAHEYQLPRSIASKIEYVGYVCETPDEEIIRKMRIQRCIPDDKTWIVCSAGGGKYGEKLIHACFEQAAKDVDAWYDIVVGPRSKLAQDEFMQGASQRVSIYQYRADLPALHAAADLMISSAGYNTLTEGMIGNTAILCHPVQERRDAEQHVHAERLKRFHPIEVLRDVCDLESQLTTLKRTSCDAHKWGRKTLDLMGAERIKQAIHKDFHIEE